MEQGSMILAKGKYYDLDTRKTKRNNNVLVVGASGAGKTRGIVIPNILQAVGSYIISDPKGNLYGQYRNYLVAKGYEVRKLDFTDPENSAKYNFFNYIRNTQDIVKTAHMLEYSKGAGISRDPFWDETSQILLQSIIAYLMETCPEKDRNFKSMIRLLLLMESESIQPTEYYSTGEPKQSTLDKMMNNLERRNKESYAVKMYRMFRVSASETLRSILIMAFSKLGSYDTPELNRMMEKDDIDISSIGTKKTALFVIVSDTDRSLDGLVNLFFTQAMNELCLYADKKCRDNRLPVPVRFILDDFATNCKIGEFPRMISSIRSRGISTMLMIQAESQLSEGYGFDAKTIIGNCDTYVYLGGNDIETARAVSERCRTPIEKILYMPVGNVWILRRGEMPFYGRGVDLDMHQRMIMGGHMD